MPIQSSSSWFVASLLAVALVSVGIGVGVDQVVQRVEARRPPQPEMVDPPEPFQPAIADPPQPEIPPPPPLKRARAVYRDRFAGFAFNPPMDWREFRFTFYSVAPDQRSMHVYQYNGGGPYEEHLSVTLQSSQEDHAEEWAHEVRADARGSEDGVKMRTTTIAGRSTFVVTVWPSNCRGCLDKYVILQWDRQTSAMFHISAGSASSYQDHRRATWKMIRSIRRTERDPYADEIGAFLEARVRGRGARPWLSAGATRHFRIWGLYKGGERGNIPEDLDGFTVIQIDRRRELVTASVSTIGIERLVFGPGRNLGGDRKPVVVIEADMDLAPGTS